MCDTAKSNHGHSIYILIFYSVAIGFVCVCRLYLIASTVQLYLHVNDCIFVCCVSRCFLITCSCVCSFKCKLLHVCIRNLSAEFVFIIILFISHKYAIGDASCVNIHLFQWNIEFNIMAFAFDERVLHCTSILYFM